MTPDDFQRASIAILRSAVGWQSAIARRLGVDRKTIQRWLKGDGSPTWADEKLREMMGGSDVSPWPRDEWLIGDTTGGDGRRREYIMHLQPPRFVARIVETDDDGEAVTAEHPADLIRGTVYTSDGYALCEIDWIEPVPAGEIVKWLEAACDEIERS